MTCNPSVYVRAGIDYILAARYTVSWRAELGVLALLRGYFEFTELLTVT